MNIVENWAIPMVYGSESDSSVNLIIKMESVDESVEENIIKMLKIN